MITLDQLAALYTNAPHDRLEIHLPWLTAAMAEFSIDATELRAAAYLAQIGYESAELRYMAEIWGPTKAQKRYEPPSLRASQLGNTRGGDGFRFRGRGPIQITGRDNYRRYGAKLGVDLENNPDLAATPQVGHRVAACFWAQRGLNELADRREFTQITRAINGGTLGISERRTYYERALLVLGTVPEPRLQDMV